MAPIPDLIMKYIPCTYTYQYALYLISRWPEGPAHGRFLAGNKGSPTAPGLSAVNMGSVMPLTRRIPDALVWYRLVYMGKLLPLYV